MKPNDRRNFVHRRIIGAVVGGARGLFSGGPVGAITGAAGGFTSRGGRRGGGSPTPPVRPQRRRGGLLPGQQFDFRKGKSGDLFLTQQRKAGTCEFPLVRDIDGSCVAPGSPRDIQMGGGVAIMGRYGAAIAPEIDQRVHRDCLPGMVLGKDDLCYNRSDISNRDRKWPKGRRPLGTPGELAALSKAASFGRRMETTVKRMQKIGVLKKPARRSAPPRAQKLLTPGVVQIQQE